MTIKALIFDIGGVLFLPKGKISESKNLLSSYKELCLLFKGINMSGEEFWEKSREVYLKSTKGEITKKQQLEALSKILCLPPNKIDKIFVKILKANIIENKLLIRYLVTLKRKGYRLGILSIQQHLSKEVLIPKKYYNLFNSMVISCDDKIRKPEPESYFLSLNKIGVKPEEALFIDDKPENLDAAEKLGINTLIFKNNKQFFKELKKFNRR